MTVLNDYSSSNQDTYDVFIAGGGIVACTFARLLVDAGFNVLMVDAGAQHSSRVGENLKNYYNYQVDADQFGGVVRGLMHPVSVPVMPGQPFTRNALNPKQESSKNLPGAVIAYALGGMAIHWTCAIPRHHALGERMTFLSPEEWDDLYTQAEHLLQKNTNVHEVSLRHRVLKRFLNDRGWPVQNTPLAAVRESSSYIRYTGADTVLGELAEPGSKPRLTICPEHCVRKLLHKNGRVCAAVIRDLRKQEDRTVCANTYVVAAGWLHTAQILWNSEIHSEEKSALGCFLSDHTFAACRVVLRNEIVQEIAAEAKVLGRQLDEGPFSLPIPMSDLPPHLYLPVDEKHRWHGQIFREAFQFDPLLLPVDTRLVIDLKWFGMIDPERSNRVAFESDIRDRLGMPQPTFTFSLGREDKRRLADMMDHMSEVARDLGDYLPGSEPFNPPLGASTHTMGATRMGDSDNGESVVDQNSKVWRFDNLYVGGNCVISTANASNPTLTSVALAIKAARHITNSVLPAT
jgi:pyranose oxidase